jgi:hypothetical protein
MSGGSRGPAARNAFHERKEKRKMAPWKKAVRQPEGPVNDNIWFLVGLTVVAVAYIGIRNYLTNRSLKKENRSDEELVSTLAMTRKSNVLEVFKSAAGEWNFSEEKIRRDFQQYLTRGGIPRYVADYARRNVTDADLKYRDLIYPRGGGRPPNSGTV